jgi:hypothetical protein
MNFRISSPAGTKENSPQFQLRDKSKMQKSPGGAAEIFNRLLSSLRDLILLRRLPRHGQTPARRLRLPEDCEKCFFVSFDYSSDALQEIESFFKRSHNHRSCQNSCPGWVR